MKKVEFLDQNEAREVIKNNDVNQRLVVNFFATWCGPCRMFAPILEEVASKGYHVIKIDVDKNKELATELQCQGIPTTIIYEGSKEIKRFTGYVPLEPLLEAIKH